MAVTPCTEQRLPLATSRRTVWSYRAGFLVIVMPSTYAEPSAEPLSTLEHLVLASSTHQTTT